MATNRNIALAEASSNTPARYNRTFARRVWRSTFGDGISFSSSRQAQREGSFRHFAGRTEQF